MPEALLNRCGSVKAQQGISSAEIFFSFLSGSSYSRKGVRTMRLAHSPDVLAGADWGKSGMYRSHESLSVVEVESRQTKDKSKCSVEAKTKNFKERK